MQREELETKMIEEIKNINLEGLELMYRLFEGVSQEEQYNVNTTQERIEELKAQKKAKERAREEEKRRNKADPYTLNPTMILLGHQRTLRFFYKYRDMFNEVSQAHPYEGTFDICIDMFSLGVICGKRLDRERRKNRS